MEDRIANLEGPARKVGFDFTLRKDVDFGLRSGAVLSRLHGKGLIRIADRDLGFPNFGRRVFRGREGHLAIAVFKAVDPAGLRGGLDGDSFDRIVDPVSDVETASVSGNTYLLPAQGVQLRRRSDLRVGIVGIARKERVKNDNRECKAGYYFFRFHIGYVL
jgi:hypothetical protein